MQQSGHLQLKKSVYAHVTAVLVYAYIKVRFSFESVASIYLGVAQPKHALHHALKHNVSRSRSMSRSNSRSRSRSRSRSGSRSGSTLTASSVISLSFRMVIRATANKSLKKKDRASNITRHTHTTRHTPHITRTPHVTAIHPLQHPPHNTRCNNTTAGRVVHSITYMRC